MANLISRGNITTTGVNAWGAADTGGAQLVVTSSTNTTTSSVANGADFTLVLANTEDGVVMSCKRVTSTGTVTVELFDGTSVVGTCTVNASVLPADQTWVFFKWDVAYISLGLTTMRVRIKGSSAGNAAFYRNGTAANWARVFSTTAVATAAATDQRFVVGELASTAGGTLTSFTETMNSTSAATVYGAVDVGLGGSHKCGVVAATAYLHQMAGIFTVWASGTFTVGTVGTPIPADTTITYGWTNSSNVDFGFVSNLGSTVETKHAAGGITPFVVLNADAAAAAASVTLSAIPTGWKNGHTAVLVGTHTSINRTETKALTADVTTTTAAITALANAHDGTGLYHAEVATLDRPIKFQGTSTTLSAYFTFNSGTTGSVLVQDVEFTNMGSATNQKGGIDLGNPSTDLLCKLAYCSFYNWNTTNGSITYTTGGTVDNCVCYKVSSTSGTITMSGTIAASVGILSNNFIYWTSGTIAISPGSSNLSTISGNRIVSAVTSAIRLWSTAGSNQGSPGPTISNNVFHSSADYAINYDGGWVGSNAAGVRTTISGNTYWHTLGAHRVVIEAAGIDISNETAYSNTNAYFQGAVVSTQFININDVTITNCTSNGGTNRVQAYALKGDPSYLSAWTDVLVENCSFGATTGHGTADILPNRGMRGPKFRNCLFASASEISGVPSDGDCVSSEKHDQTNATTKLWCTFGTITYDSTRYGTASPSIRMTPNDSTRKLHFPPGRRMIFPAKSGLAATVSVKVRKSNTVSGDGFGVDAATYNGSQVVVKALRNAAVGLSETTIGTTTSGANGAFQTLTNTLAVATDNGGFELDVTCDGTAGFIWVDDITVSYA